MRRTNSYLKGLAETRARSAGDVLRYEKLLTDVSDLLAKARVEVEACDQLIRKFDCRLDPNEIAPIQARTSYGRRGARRDALVKILEREWPREVSSREICLEIQLQFGLDFATPVARDLWARGSIVRELRTLAEAGVIERLHDPKFSGAAGRWRWKSEIAPSLDHLRAQAEAQGSSVRQCDADLE